MMYRTLPAAYIHILLLAYEIHQSRNIAPDQSDHGVMHGTKLKSHAKSDSGWTELPREVNEFSS